MESDALAVRVRPPKRSAAEEPGAENTPMKIRDKTVKELVDVLDKNCLKRPCYWPRPDPGVFTQGVGYRSRPGERQWLCGHRECRGCPKPLPAPSS